MVRLNQFTVYILIQYTLFVYTIGGILKGDLPSIWVTAVLDDASTSCESLKTELLDMQILNRKLESEVKQFSEIVSTYKDEEKRRAVELSESSRVYKDMNEQHITLLAELATLRNAREKWIAEKDFVYNVLEGVYSAVTLPNSKFDWKQYVDSSDVPATSLEAKASFIKNVVSGVESKLQSQLDELSKYERASHNFLLKIKEADLEKADLELKLKALEDEMQTSEVGLKNKIDRLESLNTELKDKLLKNQVYATDKFDSLQKQIETKDSECANHISFIKKEYNETVEKLHTLEKNSYLVSFNSVMDLLQNTIFCMKTFVNYGITCIPDSVWLNYLHLQAEMQLTIEKAWSAAPFLEKTLDKAKAKFDTLSVWYYQQLHYRAIVLASFLSRKMGTYFEGLLQFVHLINSKLNVLLVPLFMSEPKLKTFIPTTFLDRMIFVAFLILFVVGALALLKKCIYYAFAILKSVFFIASLIFCRRQRKYSAQSKTSDHHIMGKGHASARNSAKSAAMEGSSTVGGQHATPNMRLSEIPKPFYVPPQDSFGNYEKFSKGGESKHSRPRKKPGKA